MNASDAITDSLAAYRLTRLVTADVLLRPLRARWIRWAYVQAGAYDEADGVEGFIEWNRKSGLGPLTESEWQDKAESDPDAPKLAELVICRWCSGLWISFGVVLARRYASRLWEPVARALALSAAAALIAGLEDG